MTSSVQLVGRGVSVGLSSPANTHGAKASGRVRIKAGMGLDAFMRPRSRLNHGSSKVLFMTIGELARRFGIRPSALRFYERKRLLDTPARVGGKRAYDAGAVARVAFIREAQQSGLTLAEIRTMLRAGRAGAAPRRLWRAAATAKLAVLDRRITALQASRAALETKLACRCRTLAQCERKLAGGTRASVCR